MQYCIMMHISFSPFSMQFSKIQSALFPVMPTEVKLINYCCGKNVAFRIYVGTEHSRIVDFVVCTHTQKKEKSVMKC